MSHNKPLIGFLLKGFLLVVFLTGGSSVGSSADYNWSPVAVEALSYGIPSQEAKKLGKDITPEQKRKYAIAAKAAPYAALSAAVYNDAARVDGGWVRVEADDRKNRLNGFHGSVYKNEGRNEVVIVFEGTTSLLDAIQDLTVFRTQNVSANNYVADMIAKYGTDVTVTGHSLGGALAQDVAANTGIEAYTFNTQAAPAEIKMGLKKGPYNNITNIRNSSDVVNPGGEPLGETVFFDFGLGHSIEEMAKNLKDVEKFNQEVIQNQLWEPSPALSAANNTAFDNYIVGQKANFNGNLSLQTNQIITSNAVSTPATFQPQQVASTQTNIDSVSMRQASDFLVSTNADFTESFSGTVWEISPNSPTTGTIFYTSHTGSRAGVLPGSYTGLVSGIARYTTPVTPLNGVAFTGTMTGHVVGYQGVQTKGNATYQWAIAGGNSGTLSGFIILKPGGGSEPVVAGGPGLTGPVKNAAGTTIGTITVDVHNTAN